jgi:hypothetical protein
MDLLDTLAPSVRYLLVADAPNHRVGDDGTAWSWSRRRLRWRLLKPFAVGRRYLGVRIKGRNRRVHHLVLETFVGRRPDGLQCRHLDGDPRNNRLGNLKWDTAVANSADKLVHGTAPTKLVWKDVVEIRDRLAKGAAVKRLARVHGVSPRLIRMIRSREVWREAPRVAA